MRRGFALAWTAITAVIAGTAAYFSYQAGWSAGIATRIPAGAAAGAPYYWYGPHWGFGFFPFFGFLWFLFLVFVLFAVLRGFARMGRWGGHAGPGRLDDRMREWHRQAHEQQPEGPKP